MKNIKVESKAKKGRKAEFETDYDKIMKGFQYPSIPTQQVLQWSKPTDFIVKFSLYQESSNSITSTETSVNLSGF